MVSRESEPLLGGGQDQPPPYTYTARDHHRRYPRVSDVLRDESRSRSRSSGRNECYSVVKLAIIAITIVTCLTVSLPFISPRDSSDGYGNGTCTAPISRCPPCPAPSPCPTCPICPICPTCPTCPICPKCRQCPKPPPPPPRHPLGLTFNDAPWPGSTYAITAGNTSNAITFYGGDSIKLSYYHPGQASQRWTCRTLDGWLGFTIEPGDSAVYLGFTPWPYRPTLRAISTEHKFNEMFVVMKRAENGFTVFMRDGDKLRPLGVDGGGTLARVEVTDMWWGFTKV
ncbi:hypothetical protein TWF696_004572 [Orbilia brochopaga]|uniref:Uncharacterized protein n=1 Tax=Orbilia brochopaga TaxID=3140254 RepID=A0AAV9V9C2_9PEZI